MTIPLSNIVNWDMNNRHVQSSIQDDGVAVQASSILVAFGAPRLKNSRGRPGILGAVAGIQNPAIANNFASDLDIAYPVGMVENISVGQNKQLQEFFEIGSKLRYFVPGRNMNQLSMSRAWLDGPSLLKVMYSFYKNPEDYSPEGFTIPSNPSTNFPADIDPKNQPGYNKVWLNLASDLFDYSIGILLYFRNNKGEDMGAYYIEDCHITGHNFGISASSVIFSEAISMRFDRMIPINLTIG